MAPLDSIRQPFNRLLQRWLPRIQHHPALAPLLNEVQLQQLQQRARRLRAHRLHALRDVQLPMLGEKDSAFAGSGYEFAEHRPYIKGDPVKHINWRVYARTGQLVRKVFHEQRRPQLLLIVDRRSSMRFGTQQQLKITCAARYALYNLFQAQQLQLHTAAAILQDKLYWYPAQQGNRAQSSLIQHINAGCLPAFEDVPTANESSLMLNLLDLANVQLSAGSIVLFFSDFLELDDQFLPRLHALGQKHTVIAHHILDPSELSLPRLDNCLLQDSHNDNSYQINPAVTTQNKILESHRHAVHHAMQAAQIQYLQINTANDTL